MKKSVPANIASHEKNQEKAGLNRRETKKKSTSLGGEGGGVAGDLNKRNSKKVKGGDVRNRKGGNLPGSSGEIVGKSKQQK